MSNIVTIAFHVPTQKFIHIDKASNGRSCDCECLKCNEKLDAIQGEIRTKHFRHSTNLNCEGSQESALHELGKQILVDNSQIAIPKYGIINYSNPVAEKRLEIKRPDVSATFEDQQIFFEIYVSHAVDEGKEKFYLSKKHRSVEIDLSGCVDSTFEEIKNSVLCKLSNKKVFFWNDEIEIDPEKQELEENNINKFIQIIGGLIGISVVIGIIGLFSRKVRR